MKISDLDPERIVYKRPRQNRTVHLRENCRHIANVDTWAEPAGKLFPHLTVCSTCDPNHNHAETMREASAGQAGKGEGIRLLENADPEDFP